jgi:hypothetical protein
LNLPSLSDLRKQLDDALAAAIAAGAPLRLAPDRVRKAAESVVLGQGLPGDVAEILDPDRPVCTLLCFDADHIQRWVFDSERVQVVAGASRTLDRLNQRAKNAAVEIPGVTGTLYSAGGGGMLFAEAVGNRDQLVAAARRWLEKRSRGLTFTVIAEELFVADLLAGRPPQEVSAGGFAGLDRFQVVTGIQGALVRAQIKMRAAKESSPRFRPEPARLHEAFQGDPRLLERLRSAGSAVGVVTAHGNYPVRLLRRYASELQKQAKAACAERGWRSAMAWRLLTDSSPLTRKLDAAPAEDLSLDALESVLAAARAAREVALPSSTLQRLLGHYRSEERSLASLCGAARRQVLDLLAANFFRYQLARNDRLLTWWRRLNEPRETRVEVGRDAVAEWFERGGGRRLESLVDLLYLEPFPTLEAGEQR